MSSRKEGRASLFAKEREIRHLYRADAAGEQARVKGDNGDHKNRVLEKMTFDEFNAVFESGEEEEGDQAEKGRVKLNFHAW